jgi:hypothetical protein
VPRLEGAFPAALKAALVRMTAREPGARFATAAALREALLEIPGQPKDPAQALAALLVALREPPALEADALYEAVLGGAGPLTVRPDPPALAPAPAPMLAPALPAARARPSLRKAALIAGAIALSLGVILLALRFDHATPPAPGAPIAIAPAALPAATAPPAPTTATPTHAPTPAAAHAPAATAASTSRPAHAAAEAPRARARRGSLSVNALPWANIFLDDRALGHTPRRNLPVEAGRHRLRLVTAQGDVRTRTVEVAAGRETRVSVDFAKP